MKAALRLLLAPYRFSVDRLFRMGQVGGAHWFDSPSLYPGGNHLYLYQDSAGTTPVTAVGGTIGLSLDRAYGGMRGPQAAGDPGFDGTLLPAGTPSSTQWYLNTSTATVTISGSALNFTGASSTWGAGQDCLTVGRTYEVVATVSSVTGGGVRVVNTSTIATATSAGTLRCIFVAASTQITLSASGTTTASVSGVTVREIPGTHLIQATGTARPTLSARVNLFLVSEQFDSTTWAKTSATVTANATTDPLGGSAADKLVEAAASSQHLVSQAPITSVSGATYRVRVFAKAAERQYLDITTSGPFTVNPVIRFGLVGAGTTTVRQGNPAATNVSITALANGWYLCSMDVTPNAAAGLTVALALAPDSSSSSTYLGDGSSGLYLWGADCRTADDAAKNIPAYQRVGATAADHDTDGFPHYALFDGTDDSWASTATVDGSGSDKVTVVAGVTKNSDAVAYGTVFETSNSVNSVNGTAAAFAPGGVGTYQVYSRGTVAEGFTSLSYSGPHSAVLAASLDNGASTAATQRVVSINSVVGSNGGTTTAGNFGNHTLYVGRRAGTSLPLNGRIYSLVGRFGAMSDTDRNRLEQWTKNLMRLP